MLEKYLPILIFLGIAAGFGLQISSASPKEQV